MLTLFMHIPKTGGQTLHDWLGHIYGPSGLLVWNPPNLWGLGRIRAELAALLASRPELRAVAGHFPYGVHEALGGRDYRYVTFFRDPVERWISERVHHITKNADFFLLRRGFAEIYGDPDLFRLLRSTIIRDDDIDVQSRFARHGEPVPPGGKPSGWKLSSADVIERFWFVGRQESLAHDCRRLARLLGADDVPVSRSRNVAGLGNVRGALTPDEIAWIESRNRADISLCQQVPVTSGSPPAAPPAASDRAALVEAILHAALRRVGECFVALHADRLAAQKILDHYAARDAARAA